MNVEQILKKIKQEYDRAIDSYYEEKRDGNVRGMDFYDGQEQILNYLFYWIKEQWRNE